MFLLVSSVHGILVLDGQISAKKNLLLDTFKTARVSPRCSAIITAFSANRYHLNTYIIIHTKLVPLVWSIIGVSKFRSCTLSKALEKSINHIIIKGFSLFLKIFCVMVFRIKIASVVLFSLIPNWDTFSMPLASTQSEILSRRIEEKILPMTFRRVMLL